ncbi:hypothetical protein PLEOSDRAFT_1109641 [Pleurotus ostreatus PC15]|uniref:3'-5' exonuclease domain-containing protein n=1 Tax=Pleurotus ostreatus (strain PC15) TaxID=1137138 RepID=A0A067NFI1_PLEO1|nr:hypothetical protein PLEOSDRAFT_1109641 [Pleurotus ostreatus PC15]
MPSHTYPPFTLEDFTFVVATTVDEADHGMRQLMTSAASSDNVFGFDIELTPAKAVRLIQVASRTHVVVFDIALIGTLPVCLSKFVANPTNTKIGVDILGDARALPESYMRSGGELSRLHRTIDHSGAIVGINFANCVALATLSEHWINRSLDKTLQKYDWSQALRTDHYTYAAVDAAVAIQIYDAILEKHPSMAAPNPFWVFTAIDPLSEKAIGLYDEYPQYSAKNSAPIKSIEASLKKIQKAMKLADNTDNIPSDQTWNEMENQAMFTFCADLTQALATYRRNVASYSN